MTEFQVRKEALDQTRLVETPVPDISSSDGSIAVRVDRFAFTSNNITYGVAGDRLGYWQFFPPCESVENPESTGVDKSWGLLPVWGYADVIASNCSDIAIGDRLFGYFPPSSYLVMQPVGVKGTTLIDGSPHRASLPAGYNRYRRVPTDRKSDVTAADDVTAAKDVTSPAGLSSARKAQEEDMQALLFPLYVTSFSLWDTLVDNNWYNAEQIIVLSASSKTSIGLAYALAQDQSAPPVTGITSARHLTALNNLQLYTRCVDYEDVRSVADVPSVIVDMSGNREVLGRLHTRLADNMKHTLNVGITHWDNPRKASGIISERCEMFFAPSQIQKRFKDWGPEQFEQRSSAFLQTAYANTTTWLTMRHADGLQGLSAVYADVCNGDVPFDNGLIVTL